MSTHAQPPTQAARSESPADLADRVWFDTRQAAQYAGCHRDTAQKACVSGELHGAQRKARGQWRIHRDCLDAWAGGEPCSHQRRAGVRAAS